MLPFMQLLERQTIRPYVRYAHHMLQTAHMVPRVIFDHELVWIEQGEGTLIAGGTAAPYRKGDLLLIPPGTVHTLSGPFEAHKAIHFDWEHRPSEQVALDQPVTEAQAAAAGHHRGSLWLPYAVIFHSVRHEVEQSVDEIVAVFQSEGAYKQLRLQAAFSRLLLRLVLDVDSGKTGYAELAGRRSSRPELSKEQQADMTNLANRFVALVEEPIVRPDLLRSAMRDIPLSEAQIRRLFKRQYGYTPHMYVTLLCMNKARRLLMESRSTVQDIAFRCGYEDAKYFGRQFRRIEGIAPAAFRHRQQPDCKPNGHSRG